MWSAPGAPRTPLPSERLAGDTVRQKRPVGVAPRRRRGEPALAPSPSGSAQGRVRPRLDRRAGPVPRGATWWPAPRPGCSGRDTCPVLCLAQIAGPPLGKAGGAMCPVNPQGLQSWRRPAVGR